MPANSLSLAWRSRSFAAATALSSARNEGRYLAKKLDSACEITITITKQITIRMTKKITITITNQITITIPIKILMEITIPMKTTIQITITITKEITILITYVNDNDNDTDADHDNDNENDNMLVNLCYIVSPCRGPRCPRGSRKTCGP